jgi:uncharacterized protein
LISVRLNRCHPVATLSILCLIGLAVCYGFGSLASRPATARIPRLAANEQRFTLTASDGIKTAASYFPAAKQDAPGVLLFHGAASSRNQFRSQIQWLGRAGYAVLAIDFRGHGESDQVPRSFGLFEARDARAAYDWLYKKQGGAPIAAIGISLGGAAVLLGDKGPLPVNALVLQAVYPDIRHAIRNRITAYTAGFIGYVGEPFLTYQSIIRYGVWPDKLSPLIGARQFQGSALVIGGTKDHYTPVEETRALAAALPGRKQIWFAPGMGHDSVSTADTPEYQHRVLTFLDGALKGRR